MEKRENRSISDELELTHGCELHYGQVVLLDDGYFHFTGDGSLEIDELICMKNHSARSKYEFLIQLPNGKAGEPGCSGKSVESSACVRIRINCLRNTVRIKSLGGDGGAGGDGLNGGDGGDGGDCAGAYGFGGRGADGGDGGNGGSGGNGGAAPEVTVTYIQGNEDAQFLVLARDNTLCPECLSYGGRGGKRGAAGRGGRGGRGGRNADGSYAENGNCGSDGTEGQRDGANAPDGYVKIVKEERN